MTDDQHHNLPISEQFRITAKQWVEMDHAAALMEETKTAVYSEMLSKVLENNLSIAVNKAEIIVKSSEEWKELITQMLGLRKRANLLKVKMEWLRMLFSEKMSSEATERSERRL